MGVVYEAEDKRSRARVALKTLKVADAASIYRFKNEFRSLADVVHPNLVALHDLFADASGLFFTMELIEGVDFLRYVTGGDLTTPQTRVDPLAETTHDTDREPSAVVVATGREAAPTTAPDVPVAAPTTRPRCDYDRLRLSLRQLAAGIIALHSAGKLHRDIKPSNVMVTTEGRVVLLDFGLVRSLYPGGDRATAEHQISGTAEYMSPEQAASLELSGASDWYSVGVMMFQSLTGSVPFRGSTLRVLMDKQHADARRPSTLVPEIPTDLDTLCWALLRRRPEERPSGDSILEQLGGTSSSSHTQPSTTAQPMSPFVGRAAPMATLESCFAALCDGRTQTVYVHGSSGMGKSALVRRFLDGLPSSKAAVVLRGRCYERESVPYKAVDSLVDALSSHLRRLPAVDAGAALPVDVASVARLFPVLRRVEVVAQARSLRKEAADEQEVRRRGFAGLREMLTRIGIRRPLVLWIDDLQWGDVDSAALLGELLRPPEPPPLLLIASYRSEEAADSIPLAVLRDTRTQLGDRVDVIDIALEPLNEDEARALALSLLGPDHPHGSDVAASIAKEAAGSPFFIDALVRSLPAAGSPSGSVTPIRLEDFVIGRVTQLPDDARRLLEVAAVAARPIPRELAARAAVISPEREQAALSALRAAQLIRTVVGHGEEQIETYHDRIREFVTNQLSSERAADAHGRLASLLEASQDPDPEALVTHFRAANNSERAGFYAVAAAARAADALAFNRSAEWYRLALELRKLDVDEARGLRRKLGDALSAAGRGAEAADAYFAAAVDARDIEAVELRRMAASELLRGGHIDRGLAAVRDVLATFGMTLPRTPREALFSMLWRSLLLRARGLRWKERQIGRIPPEVLARVDVCWSLTTGFGVVDNVRAREMQTKHLAIALDSGEQFRVARALASEIWPSSIAGPKAGPRVARIASLAQAAAERSPNPHSVPFVKLCLGVSAYLMGKWRTSVDLLEASAKEFSDNHRGSAWEISNANIFGMWSMWNLGRLKELMRRVPALLKEARERGDLLLETTARIGRLNVVWLVADDPDRAAHEVADAMTRWSQQYVHQQHYYQGLADARVALYTGNPARGLALVDALWPRVAGAFLLKIQSLRAELTHLRAQLRAAVATESNDPAPLLKGAARDARSLAAERTPWIDGLGQLIEASVAYARGDEALAVDRLVTAEQSFVGADMALYAIAARHRRGEILGGDVGREMVAAAHQSFADEQVVRVDRMLEIFVPGFNRRPAARLPGDSAPKRLPAKRP